MKSVQLRVISFFCVTILIFFNTFVFCQKEMKVGFGLMTFTGQSKSYLINTWDEIDIKSPIGFTLNLDYNINSKIAIKSGIEYRRQNILINGSSFLAESYAIPLLLHYNIKSHKKYSLGINTGFCLERYVQSQLQLIRVNQKDNIILDSIAIKAGTIESSFGSSLNFNRLSLRAGINLSRKLEQNKVLNLFCAYNHRLSTPYFISEFNRTTFPSPGVEVNFNYKDYAPIANSGIQLGVYLTFGYITTKKNDQK